MQVSPLIIQHKVDKVADIRVTAFGNKIFGHQIVHTDPSRSTNLDWRTHSLGELGYKRCTPPHNVREKILLFMKEVGIKFGAFDFCLDKAGDWVFLEVNPSGQFAWLEIATGDPLIDVLIDLLLEKGN